MCARLVLLFALGIILAVPIGCRHTRAGVDCDATSLVPGETIACRVPGHEDRDFLLALPNPALDAGTRAILALHGGGGNKDGFDSLTCPKGDKVSPDCFVASARRAGYMVLIPDGFANPLGFRSWNHGGDGPGEHCSHACAKKVDDIGYIRDLLDYVGRLTGVNMAKVAVTGFSNGAGMAHRLACELSDRLSAVAAVSGANQFALSHVCNPTKAVPILQIHGTRDTCWPYGGGAANCLPGQGGRYASVAETFAGAGPIQGWAARRACTGEPVKTTLPDTDGDGQSPIRWAYQQCTAGLELIDVTDAGHTWPRGDQYLKASRIGPVNKDFSATAEILEFFGRAR